MAKISIRSGWRMKVKGKAKVVGLEYYTILAIQRNENTLITLLTIFDKGEIDTIKKKDAEAILSQVLNELDTEI